MRAILGLLLLATLACATIAAVTSMSAQTAVTEDRDHAISREKKGTPLPATRSLGAPTTPQSPVLL
jgi:hypothetical protein